MLSCNLTDWLKKLTHKCILLRYGNAIPNKIFRSFVYFLAISHGFRLRLFNVLGYSQPIVLVRALLEEV
jgi:hypothetical protein